MSTETEPPVAGKKHWLIETAETEDADSYLTKSLAFQALGSIKGASAGKDIEYGMKSIRETVAAFQTALEIAHKRIATQLTENPTP